MKVVGLTLFAIGAAVAAVGGYYGRAVPFAEQWPMYEALRTTASIIFAVIGAWMAIIYPERLKLSYKPGEALPNPSQPVSSGWTQLFAPVVNSTAILSVILVVGVVAPILKRQHLDVDVQVLRGCSYGLLVALTFWQVWTVILTLVPADRVKRHMDQEVARRAAIASHKRGGQRVERGSMATRTDQSTSENQR